MLHYLDKYEANDQTYYTSLYDFQDRDDQTRLEMKHRKEEDDLYRKFAHHREEEDRRIREEFRVRISNYL